MRIHKGTLCVLNPSEIKCRELGTLTVTVHTVHRSLFRKTRYDVVSMQNGNDLRGLHKNELIPVNTQNLNIPISVMRYSEDTPSGFSENDVLTIKTVVDMISNHASTIASWYGKPNIEGTIRQMNIIQKKIEIYSKIVDL